MADPAANLGSRLRHARERLGFTQREVARRSGVQVSVISDLEAGKRTDVRSDRLRRLAVTLGVSLDWLMGLSGKETLDPDLVGMAPHPGWSLVDAIPKLSS